MSLEACAQISTAALDAGIAPIARVPNGEYAIATRALDNGALGIVMPHVDTAAEAKEVVNRLKYPPVGHRSMGGIGPHYGLRSVSTGEAAQALNAANLTVVMLETPTAIANAEEIAAVPGVDVLLIGTNDLCAEMGIPGDFGNDRVAEAYRAMIAACKKHGKFPGMAGIYNEQIMPRYIDMGARFILSGQDAQFMLAGATPAPASCARPFRAEPPENSSPGESRGPPSATRDVAPWVPACAGTAASSVLAPPASGRGTCLRRWR